MLSLHNHVKTGTKGCLWGSYSSMFSPTFQAVSRTDCIGTAVWLASLASNPPGPTHVSTESPPFPMLGLYTRATTQPGVSVGTSGLPACTESTLSYAPSPAQDLFLKTSGDQGHSQSSGTYPRQVESKLNNSLGLQYMAAAQMSYLEAVFKPTAQRRGLCVCMNTLHIISEASSQTTGLCNFLF